MATFPSKVNYATGDILTATNMNDVGGAINLLESAQFAAGKNKIINGDFGIWQRGTSFSTTATYNADRWNAGWDSSPTVAISRQTFSPGTAPVAGYEGQFYQRTVVSALASMTLLDQKQYIEDVRTFAGQTVTVSFWAKADAARNITVFLRQEFGSGGSAAVNSTQTTIAATTSWVRYSVTVAVASVAGKTIGTSSYLALYLRYPASTFTIDLWGVQVEAASTASNFQTATGTIQGELAACQRYYIRENYTVSTGSQHNGVAVSTTLHDTCITLPVQMRVTPTTLETSNIQIFNYITSGGYTTGTYALTSFSSPQTAVIRYTHGSAVFTAAVNYGVAGTATAGYIGLSAEL